MSIFEPLFEEALRVRLSGTAVDSATEGRIWPLEIPQERADHGATFPCIVYQIISEAPVDSKDGAAAAYQRRVQFDCYGQTVLDAISIAQTLLFELDGSRQRVEVEGRPVDLRSIHLLNTTDNLEQAARVKRRAIDLGITFVPARVIDPVQEGS